MIEIEVRQQALVPLFQRQRRLLHQVVQLRERADFARGEPPAVNAQVLNGAARERIGAAGALTND